MNNKQILVNAPRGATHIGTNNFNDEVHYLQVDKDLINNWYHWVGPTKHRVDYDLTVVFDDIRSLSDIKSIVEAQESLGEVRQSQTPLISIVPNSGYTLVEGTMTVALDKIAEIKKTLGRINHTKLENIEWTMLGSPVRFDEDDLEKFKYTGLNNTDINTVIGFTPKWEE